MTDKSDNAMSGRDVNDLLRDMTTFNLDGIFTDLVKRGYLVSETAASTEDVGGTFHWATNCKDVEWGPILMAHQLEGKAYDQKRGASPFLQTWGQAARPVRDNR